MIYADLRVVLSFYRVSIFSVNTRCSARSENFFLDKNIRDLSRKLCSEKSRALRKNMNFQNRIILYKNRAICVYFVWYLKNSRNFRVMLVSGGKSRQVRELRRQMPLVVGASAFEWVGGCLWLCWQIPFVVEAIITSESMTNKCNCGRVHFVGFY